MTTVFKATLKPILILNKILGLLHFSYILESDGLLIKNINSQYYSFLEIFRTLVLIIFTYIVHNHGFYYINAFRLVKFWVVVIAGRLSEKWTINLINGIIEFDQKMQLLLPPVIFNDRQWLISKTNWNHVLISMFIYFIGYDVYKLTVWPPIEIDIFIISIYFFGTPYITDYVVFITVFFFIANIGYRFQTINNYWKCLPEELIAIPGKWNHNKIVMWIEDIRILHARLSEILKLFNLGYGLLLLYFFVFNFIGLLYTIYVLIKHEFAISNFRFINFLQFLPVHLYKLQIVVFMMSIIVAPSWIIEEKMKIISHLRLTRISNLPVDIKIQIKMFMVQLSISDWDEITEFGFLNINLNLVISIKMFMVLLTISEWDEISAFGFFNINLNLVVSILVLIMTGIITLIQMKNHPIVLEVHNNTVLDFNDWVNLNNNTGPTKY